MSTQQVRRIAGPPDAILRYQGNTCWQYDVNQKFPATGPFQPYTINAVRACFFAGRYSISHYEKDGRWDPPPPSAP